MSVNASSFSFPLRSLDATTGAGSSFMLRRFHGDEENMLVRRWCDESFMADRQSPWPLVLYGASATGKSALAETLACRLNRSCARLTGEEFRRQFLSAAATRSVPAWRERLREHDMFLFDELALSAEEPAIIREMVQLLEFCQQNERPVIVTMVQMPDAGSSSATLRSRLSSGLVIEIKRPGRAARREIAAELLRRFELKILEEDLDWWSRSLPETAPLIRNQISQIALACEDSLLTRSSIKSGGKQSSAKLDPEIVHGLVKLVGRQFGQRVREISGRSRRKEVVRARSVAMYLTRELTDATYGQIGQSIGGRDPSTVRHACSQIKKQLLVDPALVESVSVVTNNFHRFAQAHRGKICSSGDEFC